MMCMLIYVMYTLEIRWLVEISGAGKRSAKAKDFQCPDLELCNLINENVTLINENAYTVTMIKKVQVLS